MNVQDMSKKGYEVRRGRIDKEGKAATVIYYKGEPVAELKEHTTVEEMTIHLREWAKNIVER